MTKQRIGTIGLWGLTFLAALGMGAAGWPKLSASPEMVQGFAAMGFPAWAPTTIGILEVGGAIGLLIPRLSGLAALGLSLLMVGAAGTHVVNNDAAHSGPAIAFCLILAGLAYARRESFLSLIPVKHT